MKPMLILVILATVFITGSIFSPLLFLLSSSEIAYGQTPDQALSSPSQSEQQFPSPSPSPTPTPTPTPTAPSPSPLGQTPDQALSTLARPSLPSSLPSNPSTAQPEEQLQSPASPPLGIPGLLFPPEQQQPTSSQQQSPPPRQPSPSPKSEQPPAVAPLTQTTANGTIDSLIFAPSNRWIATGNWSMVLRNGNVNSFNTNMTWYNNNGTRTHTHEILNFKSNPIDITVKPGNNVLIKGSVDVGTNHRITWTNVHSTIDIKGGKTISISLDDKETNKHFAGQTIYGIVKSFHKCSDQPGENMEVLPPCSTSSSSSSS